MFRVLIVDDEPFIRKGLALLIKWEEYGFTLCGEAENGKKAITEIERLKPDVVVTDVRMPELDGLELIKHEVEVLKSNIRFIILSGYDDFKYAQIAIKYGVRQYILKPIEQEELIDILNTIHNELVEEKQRQEAHKHEIGQYLKAIANDTVNMIIKGDKSEETIGRAKNLFGFDSDDRFRYIQIKMDTGNDIEEMPKIQRRILEKSIEPDYHNAIFRVSEGSYGLFFYSGIIKNYRNLKEFVVSLHKRLVASTDKNVMILVGKEVEDIRLLSDSFNSLQCLGNYRFYHGKAKILYYEDIGCTSLENSLVRPLFPDELINVMETGQYEKIGSILRDMREYITLHLMGLGVLKSNLNDFRYKVLGVITEMRGSVDRINEFYSQLGFDLSKSNISDFEADLIRFCTYCADYMNELQRNQSKGIMQRVEEYIRSNYKDESLNLKNIAQHFYMNPLYLGQLFKQAYNVRFSDYMHKLRIEEAKALLRRTDLKIYEIAERVGYKDADYFASKFENLEKVTPTQYRKSLLS